MKSKQLTTTYEKFKWSADYYIVILWQRQGWIPRRALSYETVLFLPGIACLMPSAPSKFCNMLSKGQHMDNMIFLMYIPDLYPEQVHRLNYLSG